MIWWFRSETAEEKFARTVLMLLRDFPEDWERVPAAWHDKVRHKSGVTVSWPSIDAICPIPDVNGYAIAFRYSGPIRRAAKRIFKDAERGEALREQAKTLAQFREAYADLLEPATHAER